MLARYRGVENGWSGWAISNQFFEKALFSCPFVYSTKDQPCPIIKSSIASYNPVL